jgi:hypothetical protein
MKPSDNAFCRRNADGRKRSVFAYIGRPWPRPGRGNKKPPGVHGRGNKVRITFLMIRRRTLGMEILQSRQPRMGREAT